MNKELPPINALDFPNMNPENQQESVIEWLPPKSSKTKAQRDANKRERRNKRDGRRQKR